MIIIMKLQQFKLIRFQKLENQFQEEDMGVHNL